MWKRTTGILYISFYILNIYTKISAYDTKKKKENISCMNAIKL